jgi:predicted dehydrogenase
MASASRPSRRQFVQTAAAGAAALSVPGALTSALRAQDAAAGGQPLRLGFIGIGKMGQGHLNGFVGYRGIMVTAVADVDTTRREAARELVDSKYAEYERKGVRPCKSYTHYRELLADKEIDAVLIATPDHWHTRIAIEACKAGKDIYCEKPLTLTIDEAKQIVDAVRKYKRVFQTGSQQRSEGPFADAVDMVRGGRIGKIKEVHVGIGPTSKPCDLPAQDVPEGLDWNEWLGQAPQRPYNEVLCRQGLPDTYPFNPGWRDYREYSGGHVTDWGAHHYDITQWALSMDESGPSEVIAPDKAGDIYGARVIYRGSPAGDEIVVTHKQVVYEYDREVPAGKDKDGNATPARTERASESNGILFIGEKGRIFVSRSMLVSEPDTIAKQPLSASERKVHRTDGKGMGPHHRNWVDCIKTREKPICDVEVGARSVTVCHLANIAYWYLKPGQSLTWDPKKWEFTGEGAQQANAWRTRERRPGYEIPQA